ncbi:hypothetical protein CBL_06158 [Carabus blaptoides fortunei]
MDDRRRYLVGGKDLGLDTGNHSIVKGRGITGANDDGDGTPFVHTDTHALADLVAQVLVIDCTGLRGRCGDSIVARIPLLQYIPAHRKSPRTATNQHEPP